LVGDQYVPITQKSAKTKASHSWMSLQVRQKNKI
jgi:hypothetical protein